MKRPPTAEEVLAFEQAFTRALKDEQINEYLDKRDDLTEAFHTYSQSWMYAATLAIDPTKVETHGNKTEKRLVWFKLFNNGKACQYLFDRGADQQMVTEFAKICYHTTRRIIDENVKPQEKKDLISEIGQTSRSFLRRLIYEQQLAYAKKHNILGL